MRSTSLSLKFMAVALTAIAACLPGAAQSYKVTNLISDGSVPALTTDANFINPWGVSASPNWWISTQGSGFNYVVAPAGTIAFKVIVPSSSGSTTVVGLPSGSVTTAGTVGMILPNGTKASFIFSTLDGTISGWNGKLGTANAISQIAVNNSATGASYTGLAILNTSTSSYLLAPNFGGNAVEVYDSTFKATKLAGSFTDPNLPAGYAPYSIHVLGTQIIVTYAVRTASAPYRTVDTMGNGIVDIFDTTGTFVSRAVTGGNLDSPWGVAYAPASFGVFSNDLLIGNFGDGKINAYDPKTFVYQGQLMDGTGKSLAYASLWDLVTGGTAVGGSTAVSAGDTSTVYFAAGLAGEAHGLFAGISNSTTSGSTPAFGFTSASGAAVVTAGNSVQTAISLASTNGFSGTVTLACSGLPAGATCVFSPAQVSVSTTAPALATVTIQTAKATAMVARRPGITVAGLSLALMLPFGAMLALRRRRMGAMGRLLGVMVLCLAAAGLVTGCSDSGSTATPGTPAGQTSVVMTATAGAISQSTTLALTVN